MTERYIDNDKSEKFFKLQEEFKKLSEEDQRFIYFSLENMYSREECEYDKFSSLRYDVTLTKFYEDDEKISVYDVSFKLVFKKKAYFKHTVNHGVTFYKKDKKIKIWYNRDLIRRHVDIILKSLNIDWVNSVPSCLIGMIPKSVLEQIISKKITNPEELVKKLCQVSFKYKFPYKLIMKYFSNDSKEYYGYNNRKTFLSYIRDYTVNPNYTLERIVNNELSDNYMSLFQDMLRECRYFNFKINVKWSEKRLILEHAKLSKMVSDKMFSLKENEYIKYDGKLNYPDNFTVELLDESKKFFYEGNEMHNCVYTSYLKFGLNKTMFFFSVKLPERCTFNVRKDGDRFEIEQIRSIRNGNVSSSMHNMVCDWVNREDVQEWFKLNYKGLYEEKKDIDDMDDTVDFTFDNIRRAV